MKTTLLATALTLSAATAWCAKPEVIPELRQWTDDDAAGAYTLGAEARVVIPEDACPALERYAKTFADEIDRPLVREARSWWRILLFLTEEAQPGDITLTVAPDAEANPEAYTLTVGKDGVAIAAPTPLGAFWGTRTLLQVFQAKGNTFPGGEAKDWPEYAHRGFMFDCGRKPFALSTLRQLAKICAYYKLNELHLHLSDNYIWLHRYGEWFPQEVKTAPGERQIPRTHLQGHLLHQGAVQGPHRRGRRPGRHHRPRARRPRPRPPDGARPPRPDVQRLRRRQA